MDFHTWLWTYDKRWFFNFDVLSYNKIWCAFYFTIIKLLTNNFRLLPLITNIILLLFTAVTYEQNYNHTINQ